MELIEEPTKEFNKNLFFECLEKHGQAIIIKCLEVSEITKSKINNKPTIFLNMEILTEFDIKKRDGNGNIIKINPLNQIINIPYTLTETRQPNIYKVSNNSNLFPLLNQALKESGQIPLNNSRGFNITYDEIKEYLINKEFKVISKLEKQTSYKPYYKLEIAN